MVASWWPFVGRGDSFQGSSFEFEVGVEVDLRGLDVRVAEPERDPSWLTTGVPDDLYGLLTRMFTCREARDLHTNRVRPWLVWLGRRSPISSSSGARALAVFPPMGSHEHESFPNELSSERGHC